MTSFMPPESERWYYRIPTPALQQSSLVTTFIDPILRKVPADPSYGRYELPFSPRETTLRDDPEVLVHDARLYTSEDPNNKSEWLFYQVWQPKDPSKRVAKDLYLCHGVNDYGGKFAEHAKAFLDRGYRLIAPDLWSHGRSTGLHAYVTSVDSLAAAVDAVICDVAYRDKKGGVSDRDLDSRKRYVVGMSMGGFTALFYTIQYPPKPISDALDDVHHTATGQAHEPILGRTRPKLNGAVLLCPMLEIAAESRPSSLVELFARAISKFAGRWPLAEANRGKGTWDTQIDEEFELDPQTYSGKLRIATGLSFLQGILNMNARLHEVNLPFIVMHGTGDRVTEYRGSQRLYEQCSSKDKQIRLYPGKEHILLRKGKDAADDEDRQVVLKDMLDWLDNH